MASRLLRVLGAMCSMKTDSIHRAPLLGMGL